MDTDSALCIARVCFRRHLVVDGDLALNGIPFATSRALFMSHFFLIHQCAQRLKQGGQLYIGRSTIRTPDFAYIHIYSDSRLDFRSIPLGVKPARHLPQLAFEPPTSRWIPLSEDEINGSTGKRCRMPPNQ